MKAVTEISCSICTVQDQGIVFEVGFVGDLPRFDRRGLVLVGKLVVLGSGSVLFWLMGLIVERFFFECRVFCGQKKSFLVTNSMDIHEFAPISAYLSSQDLEPAKYN